MLRKSNMIFRIWYIIQDFFYWILDYYLYICLNPSRNDTRLVKKAIIQPNSNLNAWKLLAWLIH